MGFGSKESGAKQQQNQPVEENQKDFNHLPLVRVSGRVRLVGSMPFSSLVITGEKDEWYIEDNGRETFMALQQQTVLAEGRHDSIDLVLANGQHLGKRLILRDAKIIAVE